MIRNPLRTNHLTIILFIVALIGLPLAAGETTGTEGVTRALPDRGTCGETTTVTLTVEPPAGTESWILIEQLPANVTISDVDSTNNGAYNADRHRIEWVSTSGAGATHTYNLTPSADLPDSITLDFAGEYRFHPAMEERLGVFGHVGLTIDCTEEAPPVELGSVVRSVPDTVSCGTSFPVTLTVDPKTEFGAWSIDERVPGGYGVASFSEGFGGAHDATAHRIKWLSLQAAATELVYNVTVPADADETRLAFSGDYMMLPGSSSATNITGDTTTTVLCDSPPVLLLSLALIPLATVGGVLYVRRWGFGRPGSP